MVFLIIVQGLLYLVSYSAHWRIIGPIAPNIPLKIDGEKNEIYEAYVGMNMNILGNAGCIL